VFEVFEDSCNYYLIQEFIQGGDLFEKLSSSGRLPESEVIHIMRQLLSCVAYCHKNGIMHRDIKLENILLDTLAGVGETKGGYTVVKLADWGGATRFKPGDKFKHSSGTPLYIAPEMLMKKYDEKCDIWSCGVLCYLLLSGTPPFLASSSAQLLQTILKKPAISFAGPAWTSVSDEAQKVTLSMLEYDPTKRPSAELLLKAKWLHSSQIDWTLDLSKDALDNLRDYLRETRLHQAVFWFLSVNVSELAGERELMKTFQLLDRDEDGVLSREEIYQGLRLVYGETVALSESVLYLLTLQQEVMNFVDVDQDGHIDYSEFVMACIDKKLLLSPGNLEYTFSVFAPVTLALNTASGRDRNVYDLANQSLHVPWTRLS
jgi:calcium-dependent protein kinase